MPHNASANVNYMILKEITKKKKKCKNCGFLCVVKNREKFIFFSEKKNAKVNNKGHTWNKACSARFVNIMGLIKTSLGIHIDCRHIERVYLRIT